jgi:hypothetical protein
MRDDFFTHDLYHADCVRRDLSHTISRELPVCEIYNLVNFINCYPSGINQIYIILEVAFPDQIRWFNM